jgi:GT2 family glycosyltransferase
MMSSAWSVEDVGIVILAYGCSNEHHPLLGDLEAQGVQPERIFVTHNPDRPQGGWQPEAPVGAVVELNEANLGYAPAMNNGIEHFRSEGLPLILLLTHDTRLEPGALQQAVAVAVEEPTFGVVGFAVRGAGGASVSYGSFMGERGVVRHITERPVTGPHHDVPWVDGCAMLLRLDAVGERPLPDRYFMYFEEAVICSLVRQRGWRVGTALDAVASSVSGIKNRRASFVYFYLRNGFDWLWRFESRRRALGFAAREIGRGLMDCPKPGGRQSRDPQVRADGLLIADARATAILHIARRRWGPAPERLLRRSDVRQA